MQLSSERVAPLVHSVYPDSEITSCTLFEGQHSNLNYDLTLSNPPIEAVLKIYAGGMCAHLAHKEILLLQTLTSETGVPVPRVLYHDDSSSLLETPWCLLARLPGEPLAHAIAHLDQWQLESVGYEVGRYLGHIHQVPLDSFGELFDSLTPGYSTERSYVAARAADSLRQPGMSAYLPAQHCQELERALVDAPCWNRQRACLIHGRYSPANVIVQRGRMDYHVTGILEFAYARGGSPEEDIAHFLDSVVVPLPGIEKGLLDGYVEAGTMQAAFWERLQQYRALAALEALASGELTEDQAQQAVARLSPLRK